MNPSGGHISPHKVCLLLAVIDLIEDGVINKNKIFFNDQLKGRFTRHFEYLKQENDRDEPFQPFFYLNSEGFWHHKTKNGKEDEYNRRNKDRKAGSESIVNRLIDYAYFDDQLFTHLQDNKDRNELRRALGSNIKDFSRQFERWALGIGKSQKTVNNYLGAIGSSITNWIADADITDQNLLSIYSYKNFENIAEQARKLDIFKTRDSKGKGMYSAALKCYAEFLSDLTQEKITEDIESIVIDKTIESTTKSTLINARLGQGLFRMNLLSYWKCCALTGYQNTDFLVASHIKPWRFSSNEERLDVFNGVLLLPNLDKAFDKGYITFTNKGKIRISEYLEKPKVIGVEDKMSIKFTEHHQEYLSYHRDEVFKK